MTRIFEPDGPESGKLPTESAELVGGIVSED